MFKCNGVNDITAKTAIVNLTAEFNIFKIFFY